MLDQGLLPITNKLMDLAIIDQEVDEESKLLALIINQLFLDIELGNSCSRLNELAELVNLDASQTIDLLTRTNLVAIYAFKPEILSTKPISLIQLQEAKLVYITKYLQYELNIVKQINKLRHNYSLTNINNKYNECITTLHNLQQQYNLPNQEQLNALVNAISNQISIITGGPGTGKTTIVMLLLWLLYNLYDNKLKIKICAPTGRAASRVKESIQNNISHFKNNNWSLDYELLDTLLTNEDSFTTIHKLLGSKRHNIYFKHDQINPLDIDILVIDESSMISLPLFSKLLMAIDPDRTKHIIFLGDKNQLSSVEEGYVFASLIATNYPSLELARYNQPIDLFSQLINPTEGFIKPLSLPTIQLIKSNRNNQAIANLASNVLSGEVRKALYIINQDSAIKLKPCNLKQVKLELISNNLSGSYKNYFTYLQQLNSYNEFSSNLHQLFKQLQKYAILCLTNSGPYGAANVNQLIEQQVKHMLQTTQSWYRGRPILILENDYSLGLFNGDIGICGFDNNNQANIHFLQNNGEIKAFIPEILPKYSLAYAITIHKSQGSEFDNVAIILGNAPTKHITQILTKELLYTAITRARHTVSLYASSELIALAITNKTIRNSGLSYLDFY